MADKIPQHITDWLRFETFLKDLLGFTSDLLSNLHGKQIEYEYQRVLFKFIQRFHLNFTTIKNTWKDYLNNSKFRHPVYLLLRSLVSDYINMLYLIEGLKFEKTNGNPIEVEFRKRYIEISNSYFTRIDREMEKLIRDKIITVKQREDFLKAEKEFYPDHFEAGNKAKIKKMDSLQPGTIIKKLKSGRFEKLTSVYQYYFYFSQYDHFTIKTEELLENNRDIEFEIMINSINYIVRGLFLNIGTMQLEKGIIERLSKIIDGFESKFYK